MRIVLGLLKSILYSARKQPVVAAAFLAALLCWWIYSIPYVLSAASFSFLPKFVRGIAEYLMTPRVAIKQERQALPDANVIRALKALFSRRWFRRTWVIQEIAASRDAIVVCGSHQLSWDAMRTAMTRIVELVDSDLEKSPYLESDFQKMDFLSSVLDTQSIPGYGVRMKRSLLYMINCFSLFDATDARDKVYGLLGLSEEARSAHTQGQILKPNYGQPVEWVYADVVRYLVSITNQLDVLRACLGSGKVSGLPSWAPDWTVTMLRSVSGFSYHKDPFRLPDDKDQQHPVARFSEDLKVMVVRGFTIGRLIGASEICRRNLAGLGFLFTMLNDLRTKFLHGQQVTVSRTSEALAKHADSTGREKLVHKSFRCEQAPCLQWMAKTCDIYADAQAGDFICMLIGAKVPFLIRYEGTEGRLVGPANLAGFIAQSLLWKDAVKHYKMGDLQLVGYSLR
ncbi:hypothetical protein OEA41_004207 [Lepraria neglecta]|uniref:Heterokaryon incompatibility domain-containing protein n=1 Tax=Lepraria neglecta TaxID=209136 RepID=A0AAE0DJ50_9LECA|nr:hypothetical protein OEA41_004207 [Lepraria neglecta]